MNNIRTVFDVVGMTYRSCAEHVHAALADVQGVSQVEVLLDDDQLIVQHDADEVSVAALIEALHAAGYESRPSAAR